MTRPGQNRAPPRWFQLGRLGGEAAPILVTCGDPCANHTIRGCGCCSLPSKLLKFKSNDKGRKNMAKAYWVTTYRQINDPDKLAVYAQLAGPAISAGGGRFLARGMPAKAYEAGLQER